MKKKPRNNSELLDSFCESLRSQGLATKKNVADYKSKIYMFSEAKDRRSLDFSWAYKPEYVTDYIEVLSLWLEWLKDNK